MRPIAFGDGTREGLICASVADCWVVKETAGGDRIDLALCVFGIFLNKEQTNASTGLIGRTNQP